MRVAVVVTTLGLSMPGISLASEVEAGGASASTATHAAAGSEQADNSLKLDEIIVTATKREERLQDVPISVSAITGEALELRAITNVDKIATFTPNLVLSRAPGNGGISNSVQIFIRGIGQNDFVPVIDPGVGMYVDGVYLGRSVGGALDLVDVDRVEVLRGPQGTLFGRNSIGGAVNVISRKPDDTLAGSATVRFGTDSRRNVSAMVNLPITDSLFTRLSGASFHQDGYVKRVVDGSDLGDQDTRVGRAALRWVPSDAFEANLSFDYTRDRNNGAPFVLTGIQPLSVTAANGGTLSMIATQNTLFSSVPGAPFASTPLDCYAPANLNTDGCLNQRYIDPKHKRTFATARSDGELDVWGLSLTLDWKISESLQAKSISAYRTFDGVFGADFDGSPFPVSATEDIYTHRQLSQELQLLGDLFADKVDWILGAYYYQEEGKNINPVLFRAVALQSGGFYDNDSWALFGQGTYHITQQWDLTLGLRYNEDRKDYLPDQYVTADPIQDLLEPFIGVDPTPFDVGTRALPFEHFKSKSSKLVAMGNLAYRWNEEVLTYITYSEGYKSGGFTQRIFPPEPTLPAFDPEYVTSYEIGLKYEDSEQRLRLNMAAFFADYTDMQLLVSDPSRVGPFVTNAGDAEIKGAELEFTWVPAQGWLISGSAGLTDPKRTRLGGPNQVVLGLTKDSRFEHISKWMSNLQIEKRISLGTSYLTPRAEWAYRSGYGTNTNNVPREGADTPTTGPFAGVSLGFGLPNPRLYQEAFSLYNASLRWELENESTWSVTAGVDNIGDKKFRTFGGYGDAVGVTIESFDRGRQWYVSAGYQF